MALGDSKHNCVRCLGSQPEFILSERASAYVLWPTAAQNSCGGLSGPGIRTAASPHLPEMTQNGCYSP
jgi:hypothetical protein